MTSLLVALILTSDALAPVTLHGLTLKGPAEWEKTAPDENSLQWSGPDDIAQLAVSVYPLETPLPAKGCLKKLLDAVGKDGFTEVVLGGAPAAKKITTDYVGEGEEAKLEANKITTTTVLGCDGKLKWVLTWSARTSQGARTGPMLARILESVSYPRRK